jgi:hypothetical protein
LQSIEKIHAFINRMNNEEAQEVYEQRASKQISQLKIYNKIKKRINTEGTSKRKFHVKEAVY